MTWHVESETDEQRVETCDHDGTTELLDGSLGLREDVAHGVRCGSTDRPDRVQARLCVRHERAS